EERVLIEDFSGLTPTQFPETWTARDSRGETEYLIQKEMGNLFLQADVTADSVTIYKKFDWPVKQYPFFSWRWRVKKLPKEGNETLAEKNDTAAAVYGSKVNLFKLSANSIKYIWSASLPKGTEFRQKNTWVIVVESGYENLGKWMTYKVDIYKDFKRLWGNTPSNLDVLAILSDSDATRSRVIADYDDLLISKN
ncbi:MAG: DUF3047 domain-containing protein, partial [Nitrospinota bacterium]